MMRKLLYSFLFFIFSKSTTGKNIHFNIKLFCLGMFFVTITGFSQKTWVGGNGTNATQRSDWSRPLNWSPNSVPLISEDVIIPNTSNDPNITGITANAKSITINTGGVLTLSSSTSSILNVDGNITNNGTLTGGASSIVNITGNTSSFIQGSISCLFGNLTINKSTSTTTVTNSTKAFSTAGNLTVSQGNLTLTSTDNHYLVGGNLTVSTNGTLTHQVDWGTAGKQLTVSGNISLDGIYSKGTADRSHVSMNGGGKTVHSGTSSFNILTFSHTTGTITANGPLTINDNFWAPINTGGTFDTGNSTIIAYGALLIGNGTTNVTGGTLNITGGLVIGQPGVNSGTVNISGGTVTTDGITLGDAAGTTASTLTQTGGTLVVNGPVTINQPTANTVTNSWNINAATVNVSGLITFAGANTTASRVGKIAITTGTLNANGGITFVGSNAATKVIDMAGGAGSLNLKGALTVPAASSSLTAGTTSNFNYVDSNAQTVNYFNVGNYNNLNIDNTNTGGATLSAAITTTNVKGNLSVGSINTNSIFNNGGFAITLASAKNLNIANTSTFNLTGTSTMATVSGGGTKTFGPTSTVNYGGAAQTVTAETYGHLQLTGSGVKTMPSSVITVAGNFSTAGTISATAGAAINTSGNFTLGGTAFTAGNFTHTVGGNWVNNGGTFTTGSSIFNFNGTTQDIGGTNSTTFNNVTLSTNGSTKTFSKSTAMSGNLTILTGVIANLSTLGHTAATLTLGATPQATATSYGGTGSPAANILPTFFAANTGYLNIGGCTPYSISSVVASSTCKSSPATISLISTAANLPNGNYVVFYTLSSPNAGTGSASMTVSGGTGTFSTPALANNGTTNITINFLTKGCVSAISSGNTAAILVNSTPTITLNKTDETCASSNNGTITPVLSGGLTNVRYIKLTQKYVNVDAYQQVAEIEAFEIFTGTNVARSSNGATATASSIYGSAYPPASAIDGNNSGNSNFWHSATTSINEYILVDLQSGKNLDYLKIYNRTDCCGQRGQNMLLELFDASSNLLYSKTVDLYQSGTVTNVTVDVLGVSWVDSATTLNRTGLDTGTYTLNYSDVAGCSASTQANIVAISDKPTIAAISTPAALCAGSLIPLTAPTVTANGSTVTSQGWEIETTAGNNTYTSLTLPYTVAFADLNKKIRYTAINSCGTTNSNIVTLTVDAPPVAPVIAKNPNTVAVCAGTILSITVATAGTGGTGTPQDQYRYDNGSGFTAWSTTIPSFTAVAGTNTIESRRFSTGTCSTIDGNTVSWTVNAVPASLSTAEVHATCSVPTGKITFTFPLEGSGYEYSIDGGSFVTTAEFSGLSVGPHTIKIRNSSGCELIGIPVTILGPSTKQWKGTVDSDWNNGANWVPAGAPMPSDCVEIATTGTNPTITTTNANYDIYSLTVNPSTILTVGTTNTLTVNGAVTVLGSGPTAGSLIFENNSSLLQTSTDPLINTGNITYRRTTSAIRRYDQIYWGTPVTAASNFKLSQLSSLTFIDKYLSYDTAASAWFVEFAGNAVMLPGRGYNVRAPQTNDIVIGSAYNAEFIGTPNNGDIPVTTVNGNWCLAGNPYPSAVDAKAFIGNNGTAVGTLYFWTHASPPNNTNSGVDQINYSSADYTSFNLTGSTVTADPAANGAELTGFIGAGQGFFFRAGNGAVKFTNAMRAVGENSQFFKTEKAEETEKSRVFLNFKNKDGAFKQILIGYLNGATNDWDINYDAATMNGNTYVDFYSINSSKKLAIQGRALPFDNTEIIPLGYKSTIAGDFTIAIDHVDGVFTNQPVYLEDKLTGKIQNLTTGNYTFTTAIGTFTDRFVLRYTDKTLGTGDIENLENTLLVSIKDKAVKITSSKETLKDVIIFDISGKQLYEKKKIGTTELQISNLQSSNQVLLVKVTLENGFTTTRKIIFQ